MAVSAERRLTTEQKVFVVQAFYETNNKSDTCRRFTEKFNRQTTRETVGDAKNIFE